MKNTTGLLLICALFFFSNNKLFSQQFNGIWQSEGYGFIMDITTTNVDVYDYTSMSLLYEDWYNLNGNEFGTGNEYMGDFSLEGSSLLLTLSGGTQIYFEEIDGLPDLTAFTTDPQINFDVFFRTNVEWSAIPSILNEDWQTLYNYYDALIDENTSQQQLFDYMEEIMMILDDGHSYIEDTNGNYYEGGPMIGDLWYEYEYPMMDLIEDEYIDGGNYLYQADELIAYGTIYDSIGYLAVNSMDGYSNNDLETQDNIVFENALEVAMNYLQNSSALIIDIRFNYGGYDSNSRILGNRLVSEEIPVYSKQAHNGAIDQFVEPPTLFSLVPEGTQFLNKPVVVLTSSGSISASDVFALLAKEIPCVTLIGESTYGIFSDNYMKYLPNDWELGISPERYLDVNGVNWEQQGVQPDILVMGDVNSYFADIDNILEAAIDEIFNTCSTSNIEYQSFDNRRSIAPNPAMNSFRINNLQSFEVDQLKIVDVLGKSVTDNEFVVKKNGEVDIQHLLPGNYIVSIITIYGETQNYRLMKQ